ncbi:MAG: dihydrodipicolinate synthase family protein [Burkholderiales bacterium]|nr:dihydrodipicolinate synthase family protein [Burkholderiales bacterium]
MAAFIPGLVHTPVTPFTSDNAVDFGRYAELVEFHIKHGADALALPMHAGESVSLSDGERQQLLELALKTARGRVPVIAHVSDSGTGIAADRARAAERAGAAAVVATTPYYWTPPAGMVLEHFAQIGAAVQVPFFALYAPQEMHGTKITTDMVLKLMDRVPNFAGVIDASLDWQSMINIVSNGQRKNAAFQLLSGSEYMISAGAIGASSVLSSLAGIAPTLVRRLYDLCKAERYAEARPAQEALAALWQLVKPGGAGGLKAAMQAMDRDCGGVRPPLDPVTAPAVKRLATGIAALPALAGEPRGW